MAKKSVAAKAFEKAHEGRLTAFGWPDAGKLIAAAKAGKNVMPGLNMLANFSGDAATKAKARAIRERIKAMHESMKKEM